MLLDSSLQSFNHISFFKIYERIGKRNKVEDIVRAPRQNPESFGAQRPKSLKIVDVKHYRVRGA